MSSVVNYCIIVAYVCVSVFQLNFSQFEDEPCPKGGGSVARLARNISNLAICKVLGLVSNELSL